MLSIIRITKDKGPFYQIDFSDGESLKVSEDILVRYRLLKGQELENETIEEIKKNSGFDFGLQQALNYLSYQLRTEKEIRIYLKDKEIGQEDRHKIVDRLKELGLINDLTYGESYVRTNMRLSDKGPKKLAMQMQQKGLTPEIIEQALEQYTFEDQVENAHQTAEKTYNKNYGKSQKELLRNIQQRLMTKGFSSDVIQEAIEALPKETDPEEEYELLVQQGDKLWRKNSRFESKKRKMKVKQSLYQKGFNLEMIQRFILEKEEEISE
ncbi:recombination regulator RecX [Enterococcus sp. 10A9_DIV0425]|uniref:Regulatory protein RecX n=1 Tax=Candidatus Enterococcus wittei TaxID=1987383 RepID=A0A242JVZ4_9ENTE|nr:recombination regulator RecX [Enterococcus sp. 10A9_DIV0425]OTP09488.1 recombination regulator RecX [Enterococcus sp. 10A9_DIV0425]THE09157.1 recombination regulator RecX [Enterococcus hirae]